MKWFSSKIHGTVNFFDGNLKNGLVKKRRKNRKRMRWGKTDRKMGVNRQRGRDEENQKWGVRHTHCD